MQRLNKDNPTPNVGEYKCTAPCAEVGLAPGETCVFGYINFAKLVTPGNTSKIDFDKLKSIITLLMRALDNILEISIQKYSIDESKSIMAAKRKIGIGVCGFADMLMLLESFIPTKMKHANYYKIFLIFCLAITQKKLLLNWQNLAVHSQQSLKVNLWMNHLSSINMEI